MRVRNVRCCAVLAAALLVSTQSFSFEGRLFAAGAAPRAVKADQVARGRELFLREWRPLDTRCRDVGPGSTLAGDGLGPVFNDISCGACHSLGGVGGAGPQEKNVQILVLRKEHGEVTGEQFHPGLALEGSATVLHRSSVLPSYVKWRQTRLAMADTIVEEHLIVDMLAAGLPLDSPDRKLIEVVAGKLSRDVRIQRQPAVRWEDLRIWDSPLFLTERNPPALFGARLIDAISEGAILEAADRQQRTSPQIAGRVSRTRDRHVGRFGWQAQKSSLADFTLTACAVELGLTVPGHPQASDPHRTKNAAPGLDMNQNDCDALVAFVASVPPPREQVAPADAAIVRGGKQLFTEIGCAGCHLPDLGGVKGIYSDLLLHDMGLQLAGEQAAGYGAFVAEPEIAESEQNPKKLRYCGVDCYERRSRATDSSVAFLCRTPPLWGVASSAPYLHDGRAPTLRDAILMHAGQGSAAAAAFQALDEQQRQFLLKFLSSLVAPRLSDVAPFGEVQEPIVSAYPKHRKKPMSASFKPRRRETSK